MRNLRNTHIYRRMTRAHTSLPCHSLQNDREKASPQCGSKNAVSALISLKSSAKCYCHPTHVISDFISNLSVRSFLQHLIVMGELASYMYTLHIDKAQIAK
jgi:hypothetical protein